jgi:oxygen-independent coproporphyrinogen III oxidase
MPEDRDQHPNPQRPPGDERDARDLSLSVVQGGSVSSRLHAGAALREARRGSASSLYIHVPFCFHKCHYCDFYSIVDTRDRQEPFVERLLRELTALTPWASGPLETVFIGGGTPSLLAPHLWRRLLHHLDACFATRTMLDRGGEFTVECNPETVTSELADAFAAGGVTRVSMGAQSFKPTHLKTLERWHDPSKVAPALDCMRSAGIRRQSIDLIFGIPGQSMDDWREDLTTAVQLDTEHLSCYGLTYEQGTAMTARLERGEFTPADEDLEADMFEATIDHLARQGLHRYELSNFARPGAECRHNLVYWRQGNWLAAGPAASGHIDGLRWKNVPRLDDHLKATPDDTSLISESETPSPARNLIELLMTGLRLSEGLDPAMLLTKARTVDPHCETRLVSWSDSQRRFGLLAPRVDRWVLTDDGMRLANQVILAAAEAVEPT